MEVAARGGDRGTAEGLLHQVDGRTPVEAVARIGSCSQRSMEMPAIGRLGPMLLGNQHLRRHSFVSEPDAHILAKGPLRCNQGLAEVRRNR
jgi:hypothetical protein